MLGAQPHPAPVSRLELASPRKSGGTERLRLLREEIAGCQNLAGETTARRIPLGHGRLDRILGGGLKLGGLHEMVAARQGDHPAALGFTLALAAHLRGLRKQAPIVWIGEDFAAREQGTLYGPGLLPHGIDPASLLLVHAANAKETLWALEEALKCRAPATVIGEIWTAKLYDLTASRRLVLAAQKSGTPALLFLAGLAGADAFSSGSDTRFEIRASPSPHQASAARRLPLPGAPAWSVRIAKARAGPAALDHKFHPVLWTEALFRDALSLPLAAFPGDGPDPSAGEIRALGV